MRNRTTTAVKGGDMERYRIVVGEQGNERGHIIAAGADERRARRMLARELAKYGGDGWGRLEVNCGAGWERLD